MKWYISGPMTGKPQFNIPQFILAREELVAKGYAAGTAEVLCPHDNLTEEALEQALGDDHGTGVLAGMPYATVVSEDIHSACVNGCNHVLLLNEWWKSRGARVEAYFAISMGWRVYLLSRYRTISEVDVQYILGQLSSNPPAAAGA